MSFVYFIQRGPTGPIKIGKSVDPEARRRTLQCHSRDQTVATALPKPDEVLYLRATVPGGLKDEREYQRRFAAHRLGGEWFKPAPALLAEIARLASA